MRRVDAGVQYQQLEMGAKDPSSTVADQTTCTLDVWDDGWDDNWDGEVVSDHQTKNFSEF